MPETALQRWPAALNHTNDDDHDRDYQQNVMNPENGVRSGQSQRPKDKQNDSGSALLSRIGRARWWPLAAQYCGRPTNT
jgi:hypothetical protein